MVARHARCGWRAAQWVRTPAAPSISFPALRAEAGGARYAEHLAVAEALRSRLQAAGHAPRDLFDVYAYEWRTLSKSALASAARASG